jgi:hypothetical protein
MAGGRTLFAIQQDVSPAGSGNRDTVVGAWRVDPILNLRGDIHQNEGIHYAHRAGDERRPKGEPGIVGHTQLIPGLIYQHESQRSGGVDLVHKNAKVSLGDGT